MSASRPLRFCMITTFYPPYHFGGDGIFVYRLANALAERGHHVEVVHCVDAYHAVAGVRAQGSYENHPNVTVHSLRSRFGVLSPIATQQTGMPLFKASQIRRVLARGFDVIHYHNISLVGGPKVLEYGRGLKLYTMHEYWLGCPTHVLFRYNRAPCVTPHCFTCTLSYRRPPQWWRYLGVRDAALRHVDAFIAPSRFGAEAHRRLGLNLPTVHLPHFVPRPANTAIERGGAEFSASAEPYFLFVGRLEKLKGLHTLIPVFRRYRRARLLIAGSGAHESQLRNLAGDDPNVVFLGHLHPDELQGLVRRAHAVIVPSICFEVFPLVTIEAFAQRTPVIVRNLGGMPEVIEESGGGFVYHADEDLMAALDRLLDDPSERLRLGELGYSAYQRLWSVEAHLDRYFELIDSRIGTSAAPINSSESRA